MSKKKEIKPLGVWIYQPGFDVWTLVDEITDEPFLALSNDHFPEIDDKEVREVLANPVGALAKIKELEDTVKLLLEK